MPLETEINYMGGKIKNIWNLGFLIVVHIAYNLGNVLNQIQ